MRAVLPGQQLIHRQRHAGIAPALPAAPPIRPRCPCPGRMPAQLGDPLLFRNIHPSEPDRPLPRRPPAASPGGRVREPGVRRPGQPGETAAPRERGRHGRRGGMPSSAAHSTDSSLTRGAAAGAGAASPAPGMSLSATAACGRARNSWTGNTPTGPPAGRGGAGVSVAVWNSSGASVPRTRKARPGLAMGMAAASRESMTSKDSGSDWTLRATQLVTLARISAVTAPWGRWVAMIEVDPQRAADGSNPHELGECGRGLVNQHPELVDDEDQVGQRRPRRIHATRRP